MNRCFVFLVDNERVPDDTPMYVEWSKLASIAPNAIEAAANTYVGARDAVSNAVTYTRD